jgi:hypothetical protein
MRRLPRLNITNLWDSSSSSDDDIEILDDHPILSISTTTNNQSDQSSLPLINHSNMGRLSLLPAFPSLHQHGVVVYRNREHLLLANVPRLFCFLILIFLFYVFCCCCRSSINK